ncbi:hypothetical protein MBRA1_003406 [Malassezia brasiliensis]|uniref:Mediator of RNA polymerase II transcription subunit 7 n=1 Tax=Malassezia brasiliensis TaxID=1821822 RepID=A0AAF0DZD4_9BASI|nr:hypothetical protein MBRA1_003406 [Malassezia brasiliensis]
MADDAGGEPVGNTSVFPPPPAVYAQFTEANVLWLKVLQEELRRTGQADAYAAAAPDARRAMQAQLLADAAARDAPGAPMPALPDTDLHELEPPNVAWIEEDGGYQLFGQRWPIPEATPSLEALGIPRMFPDEPFDRAAALETLLRTLLLTYVQLTNDLLRPIQPFAPRKDGAEGVNGAEPAGPANGAEPVNGAEPAEPANGAEPPTTHIQDHLHHLETAVINFQFLLNQLRPVQASASLEQLLATQVERRERQTQLLRDKCAAIRAAIARLSL